MSESVPEHKEPADESADVEYVKHQQNHMRRVKSRNIKTMRREVAQWIGQFIGEDLLPANLMDEFKSGVKLLNFAKSLHLLKHQESQKSKYGIGEELKLLSPDEVDIPGGLLYGNAQVVARQRSNIAKFLQWCGEIGVKRITLFESEDLVLNKNEHQVLNCILQIARIVAKDGIEPPESVKEDIKFEEEKRKMTQRKKQEKQEKVEITIEAKRSFSTTEEVCKTIIDDQHDAFEILLSEQPMTKAGEEILCSKESSIEKSTPPLDIPVSHDFIDGNTPNTSSEEDDLSKSKASFYTAYDVTRFVDVTPVSNKRSYDRTDVDKQKDGYKITSSKKYKSVAMKTLSYDKETEPVISCNFNTDGATWDGYIVPHEDHEDVISFLPDQGDEENSQKQPDVNEDQQSHKKDDQLTKNPTHQPLETFYQGSNQMDNTNFQTALQFEDFDTNVPVSVTSDESQSNEKMIFYSPASKKNNVGEKFSKSSSGQQTEDANIHEKLEESQVVPIRVKEAYLGSSTTMRSEFNEHYSGRDYSQNSLIVGQHENSNNSKHRHSPFKDTKEEENADEKEISIESDDSTILSQSEASSKIVRIVGEMGDVYTMPGEHKFYKNPSTSSIIKDPRAQCAASSSEGQLKEAHGTQKSSFKSKSESYNANGENAGRSESPNEKGKTEATIIDPKNVEATQESFVVSTAATRSFKNQPGPARKVVMSADRYKIPIVVLVVLILLGIGGIIAMIVVFPQT